VIDDTGRGKDRIMATLDLVQGRSGAALTTALEADGAAIILPSETLASLERKGLLITGLRHDGRLVLRLEGKLVSATAPLLKAVFADGPQAVHLDLDLAGCTRADGMGLATVVRLGAVLTAAGGSLRVVNLPPALRQTVMRINLHHLVDIVEATGDA
jgi:anti-anti-sigma regulatory factor